MIKKSLIVFIFIIFLLSPFSFNANFNFSYAFTEIYGQSISSDTTWDMSGSPYLIYDDVFVSPAATLTIGPGVIIKLGQASLIVKGRLNVLGEEGRPVIFTSINDDARGGHNVQSSGQPATGDWGVIKIFAGGSLFFNHAVINYGGWEYIPLVDNRNIIKPNIAYAFYNKTGVIKSTGGQVEINNSEIALNEAGIFSNAASGQIFVHNSKIYDNLSGGIINYGVPPVDAINNWWGDDSGPYHETLNPQGRGNLVSDNVLFDPWIGKTTAEPEPVIIVPGIMGSWNVSGRWQIDLIFHTYDNLMEALIAAGYKESSLSESEPTLFTFPYNWRADNNITAGLLKAKIDLVKEITGSDKVDIIAHSMGGLVTRSYIEGGDYQNDIDQVIFLGTPHQGSLESYLKYEGAYFSGYFGAVQKYLFQVEATLNGYFDLTDYIRSKVLTVEQLLPTFDYLKDKQPDNSWQLRPYPLNYPQNNYLENLNSQANVDLLKQRVGITNIIGDLGSVSTLNSLKVVADPDLTDNKWQSGYPENLDMNLDSLEMGSGDGIVPLSSASSLNGVDVIETNSSDHANLPTIMQKEIIKVLTDKEPADYFNNKITSTIKRWYFFRVYSPVDFLVTSPNGEKIGKDFASSTEINQIPDAFYSGFGNQAEFILIPNPQDGEYKIEVQGVGGGGEYTFASSYINEDDTADNQDAQIQSEILSNTIDNFTLNFNQDNPAQSIIEPEVDFDKLIELTNELYNAGEIEKENIKKLLILQFGLLNKQYDKILSSQNNKQKQLLKIALKLELKLLNKTLDLYLSKEWMTVKAKDILSTNINFLIDKLK